MRPPVGVSLRGSIDIGVLRQPTVCEICEEEAPTEGGASGTYVRLGAAKRVIVFKKVMDDPVFLLAMNVGPSTTVGNVIEELTKDSRAPSNVPLGLFWGDETGATHWRSSWSLPAMSELIVLRLKTISPTDAGAVVE